MNHFSTYLLAATLLISSLTACEQDATEPQPEESLPAFYVQAQQDGKAWLEQGSGAYNKTQQTFSIATGNPSSTQRYAKYTSLYLPFSLSKKQFDALAKSTPAQVQSLPAYWFQTEYEDIITDRFGSDSLSLPAIEITRLDTVEKIVEGRFHATLKRAAHFTNKEEFKRFEEGSFRVRYKEFTLQ